MLEKHPDSIQNVRGRVFDYVFFFAAIGATLSFVGVAGNSRAKEELFALKSLLIVVGFTAYGAVMGVLLADLRHRVFHGGRLSQFGIRDLLLVMAMVALSLALWHYTRWL